MKTPYLPMLAFAALLLAGCNPDLITVVKVILRSRSMTFSVLAVQERTAASGKFCPKNFLYLSPESFGFDS